MADGVLKKEAFSLKLRSWAGGLFPIFAVVAALLVGGVTLLTLGASPIAGFGALIDGAFGGLRALSDTAAKAVPLLLVAAGITIVFRSNVINIGGEGQIILGALFGTHADQAQLAPSVVVASQVCHWEVVMKEIIDLMGKGHDGREVLLHRSRERWRGDQLQPRPRVAGGCETARGRHHQGNLGRVDQPTPPIGEHEIHE